MVSQLGPREISQFAGVLFRDSISECDVSCRHGDGNIQYYCDATIVIWWYLNFITSLYVIGIR